MRGATFVTNTAPQDDDYLYYGFRLCGTRYHEGVYHVCFDDLMPPGESIHPELGVVLVDAMTGECSMAELM